MKQKPKPTRIDQCYAVGQRARKLNAQQAAAAWRHLGHALCMFDDPDRVRLPKFADLLNAINHATHASKKAGVLIEEKAE